jgi:hypothetical protein
VTNAKFIISQNFSAHIFLQFTSYLIPSQKNFPVVIEANNAPCPEIRHHCKNLRKPKATFCGETSCSSIELGPEYIWGVWEKLQISAA